jgi:hypothetical protein
MVKVCGDGDVVPGTETPTEAVPAFATNEAGTVADNCVEPWYVVLSGDPFQVTMLPLVNPEPVAVNVNAGLPATAVLGEIPLSVTGAGVIVKGSDVGEI